MATLFTMRRIQHVSVPRPAGRDDEARQFYGATLGLQEIPIPEGLAHLDLIWYRIGDDELHLFRSDSHANNPGQHFCIQVDDVAALGDHLASAGVGVEKDNAITNRPRLYCHDPFGNLIEVTAIQGLYV